MVTLKRDMVVVSYEQMPTSTTPPPSRFRIALAFLAIYVIWGSTYLAIRFAIETIPPFLMAATRFLVPSAILFLTLRLRGEPAPTARQWRSAAIIGAALLLIGNGGVTWAEQMVPSGVAALLISTVPLWIALLDWLLHGGGRPGTSTVLGIIIGFAGMLLLVGPAELLGGHTLSTEGAVVLTIATISWSAGSLYSRTAPLPSSPLMAVSMEMLCGGALLFVLGAATGEFSRVHIELLSFRSVSSLLYLMTFGSLLGFSAYVWLLRVVPASRVATYAYVNPVIAVLLGWALAGEELTSRMLIAAAIIIAGVVVIINQRR
jgi:drug/metabolite transporter (DMT)-like permease